jgi:hypothetical protein
MRRPATALLLVGLSFFLSACLLTTRTSLVGPQMSPDLLLYDRPAVVLLASLKDEDQDYWDGFVTRAETAGLEATYQDKAQILVVRLPRPTGDFLTVHYAIRRSRPGGGGNLALQPLMAWQRGVGSNDLVLASADNIGGELAALSQTLRQLAPAPAH